MFASKRPKVYKYWFSRTLLHKVLRSQLPRNRSENPKRGSPLDTLPLNKKDSNMGNERLTDAVGIFFAVCIFFCVIVISVYAWRGIASRYRKRRLERQQALPVHRTDATGPEAPGTSQGPDHFESLRHKSRKHNKYRERILAATSSRRQPSPQTQKPQPQPSSEPQQPPPPYIPSPKFEEVPLNDIDAQSLRSSDRYRSYKQQTRAGRRGYGREMATGPMLPPAPQIINDRLPGRTF
ncbi:hypothetical protein FQN54_003109 [Arachnomyces sp. PD_36]|nr:hypothetical protein FQN54_003109 [Arachnomyces sp. PD_36]